MTRALVALAIIHASLLQGQTSFPSTPKRFLADELRMWSSPFRRSSYDSRAVQKYVIPFALISGVLIATDRKTENALPNTPDQTKWSGRVSQLGAWYSMVGVTGSSYLIGKFARDDHAREAGILGLEALGHSQLAVFTIKRASNRQRPVDQNGRGSFWEGGTSFPSGHSSSAFAVATIFVYEYRDNIRVPIVAYSVASLIAASRAGARRHWISDIFVGSSLGFIIGRFTYRRNHDSKLPGVRVSHSRRLFPEVGLGRSGPALTWHF